MVRSPIQRQWRRQVSDVSSQLQAKMNDQAVAQGPRRSEDTGFLDPLLVAAPPKSQQGKVRSMSMEEK